MFSLLVPFQCISTAEYHTAHIAFMRTLTIPSYTRLDMSLHTSLMPELGRALRTSEIMYLIMPADMGGQVPLLLEILAAYLTSVSVNSFVLHPDMVTNSSLADKLLTTLVTYVGMSFMGHINMSLQVIRAKVNLLTMRTLLLFANVNRPVSLHVASESCCVCASTRITIVGPLIRTCRSWYQLLKYNTLMLLLRSTAPVDQQRPTG